MSADVTDPQNLGSTDCLLPNRRGTRKVELASMGACGSDVA